MKNFAVILAGSGVYDGSEIYEVSLSLLAIQQQGGSFQCFAPNINQHHVLNHLSGEEMNETRNVLVESARVARGDVKDIKTFNQTDFDILLIPGGFGVAKNLCDFAFKGADCSVIPEVETVIKAMHEAKKPIGALCISPVLIAKILGDVRLTIGQDEAVIENVEKLGSKHFITTHGDVIVDEKNKIFTTPCFMLDANIEQVYTGTTNIIKSILESLK